ncbi:hypothetical protein GCM10017044_20960 [Kordiimonas sediminis]|uniref:Uncharacterized protein n=1 Tax=Kordiimonas sediminis TaxID=1735581 RepID=A0A919E8S3_9PROT|nr:hypothetical protein [Kordiimonas sediminis]GHF25924.1 hypothetical protein GCM10017044_20960 [Kordiimonas sediminis]
MSFSIMNTVNQTVGITLQNIGRIFVVLLIVVVAFFLISLVGFGLSGALSVVSSILGFVIGLITVLVILAIMGAWFNYWVRVGALGADAARQGVSDMFKAGLVNGIKMILIGLLLALGVGLIFAALGMLGYTPTGGPEIDLEALDGKSALEIMTILVEQQSAQSLTLSAVALNLVSTAVVCLIYSLFSANLTHTALGDSSEGFEHAHTADFAVALIIIYMALLIPSYLAAAVGSVYLAFIVQIGIGVPVSAAIAMAHGVRYRLCTGAVQYSSGKE